MSCKFRTFWGAVAILLFMAVPASADAQLSRIKGKVFVNSGAGYIATTTSRPLNTGYRVLVSPKSSATITFGDGCSIPIRPGNVIAIRAQSPCTAKAQANLSDEEYCRRLSEERRKRDPKCAPFIDPSTGVWIAGGVGAALIIGGIVALSNDGDNNVASP